LLEWDKSKGEAPAPLLKVKYASERKKAKTVNFSIAYGKSAIGFSEDWNCTVLEAKGVIKAWFADRPEVEKWQKMKQ
jgi:DNA polymerase-1